MYQQQQAAIACQAATCIQAAWRGRQARTLLQQLRASYQQSLKTAAAAGLIQVTLLTNMANAESPLCCYSLILFMPSLS